MKSRSLRIKVITAQGEPQIDPQTIETKLFKSIFDTIRVFLAKELPTYMVIPGGCNYPTQERGDKLYSCIRFEAIHQPKQLGATIWVWEEL